MTAAPMHDVKSAAAVLADDVICQSFIQSSSTLAYACLLIRRAKYDLASHVLHSLEAKQASRFKDMVFYLQAQIGIETGEHASVKRRLVPRVHQHPNDMVALSLLETCIYLEFAEWEKPHPRPAGSDSQASTYNDTPDPAAAPDYPASPVAPAPEPQAPQAVLVDRLPEAPQRIDRFIEVPRPQDLPPVAASSSALPSDPAPATPVVQRAVPAPAPIQTAVPASGPSRVQYAPPTGSAQDTDFGLFQGLANDANTQAIALWNSEKGRFKSACRNAGLESLVAVLPHEVPIRIQSACTALDAGIVNKICFSFQNMTVTSFHSGPENMGLITGHINQSLLSIVRAENTFRKQAASLAQAASQVQSAPGASNRNAEYAPND